MKHVAEPTAQPDLARRRAHGPRQDDNSARNGQRQSSAAPLDARALLGLQQSVGNSAVAGLVNGTGKHAGMGSPALGSLTQMTPPRVAQGASRAAAVAERGQAVAERGQAVAAQSETAAEQAKGGERRAKAQTAEAETAARAGATQAEAVAAQAQGVVHTGGESDAEEGGQAHTEAATVYEEATGGEQADAKAAGDTAPESEAEAAQREPAAEAGATGGEESAPAAEVAGAELAGAEVAGAEVAGAEEGGAEEPALDAEHDEEGGELEAEHSEAGDGEPDAELTGDADRDSLAAREELRRSIREGRRLVNQELTDAHSAEVERIQAAVSRTTAALGASAARQTGRLASAEETSSGAVRAAFATARQQLGSAIAGAKGGVQSGGQAGRSQLGTWQGQASGRAQAQVSGKAERTRALGGQFAGQGQAAAAQTTDRVSGDVNTAAGQVQGQSGSGGGGGNEAAASGNAEVAGRVSGETVSKVRSEGAQVVSGVQNEGAKVGQTFQQKGGEAAAQIQSQLPGALGEVRSLSSSAQGSVGQAVAGGLGTLGKLQQATGKELAGAQVGILGQISSTVAATRAQLAQAATQAQAAIRAQGATAGQALTALVSRLRARVRRALVPREQAGEVAGGLKGELRGHSSGAIVGLGDTASQVAAAGAHAADAAVRDLAQQEAGARSQAAASTHLAARQASATSQGTGRQVRLLASRAMSTGSQVLTAFDTKLDSAVTNVDSTLAQGMGDVQGQMADHAGKAASRAGEAPGKSAGKIDEGQGRVESAADKKEPESGGGLWGWAKRQAKAVWDFLKAAWEAVKGLLTDPGFWVSLVVGVALMAFAVATFGSGLAVLAIAGAVVGAISGGVGQIVTNVTQGKPWNEGLLKAVAIGGIGGLVFGPLGGRVAGAIGSRLASTAVGRGVSAAASRVASSAVGRGASAVGRGISAAASRGASTTVGRGVSAAARAVGSVPARVGTQAGQKAKDIWNRLPGVGGKGRAKPAPSGSKLPEQPPGKPQAPDETRPGGSAKNIDQGDSGRVPPTGESVGKGPGKVPDEGLKNGIKGKAPGAGGHEVKVTRSGRIMVCSECEEIAKKYAKELADDPELDWWLDAIRMRQRSGASPDEVAEEAATLQKELEKRRQLAQQHDQNNPWNKIVREHPDPSKLKISHSDRIHILNGDRNGGGHGFGRGIPGKTEFPEGWDDEKVIDEVLDVARRPDRIPFQQADDDRWVVEGVRDGVEIRVVLESDGSFVTAHPFGGAGVHRNPE